MAAEDRVVVLAGFPADVAPGMAARLPGLAVHSVATVAAARAAGGGASIIALDEGLAADATDALLAELGRERSDLQLICALRARPPLARMLRLAGELQVARILYQPVDREELARTIAELAGVTLAPAERPDDESADLAEIWRQNLDAVLARVGVLENAIVGLLEGRLDSTLATEARREAHTLAGSVALFGFARASAIAREIETAFRAAAPPQHDAPRLAQLAVELRTELASAVSAPRSPGAVADAAVLLITDDPVLGPTLAAAIGDRGLRARICAEIGDARRLARRPSLRAILVDLAMQGGGEAALDVVRGLSLDPDAPPIVALAVGDSTADRVAVARARASAFIARNTTATEIADSVVILAGDPSAMVRVLAVDDDRATVEAISAMLGTAFDVITLTEPLRFWDVLEECRPDVVLLDLNMPVVTGIELCRTLRADPRWSRIPVLFLTSATDHETMLRICAVGADDYLTKPVRETELAARITNRLARTRAFRRSADLDGLTGVRDRGFLLARLAERLATTDRRSACALVALRIDDLAHVRTTQGAAAADRVLVRIAELLTATYRGDDIVARLGTDRFGVIMGGFDREGGRQRIADLCASLAVERFKGADGDFSVAASVGVAGAPEDGTNADSLVRIAERSIGLDPLASALTEEDRAAPRVAAAEATVDVVVVDDDRALSNLLVHGLRARGYTVEWYTDGAVAAAALTGISPTVRPRVILLDVDLPGLDGHSLLRQLATDGALALSRVIMLTLRSNESEILMALKAGAFDHVAKPFSMPILIERVRRALESRA